VRADGTSSAAEVTPHAVDMTSADGVRLSGIHLPGPGGDTAVAVCHASTHHLAQRRTLNRIRVSRVLRR
jgi:hypothetical protein